MTLATLIKKGGLSGMMTMTVATSATVNVNKPVNVAKVATVTVAEQPKPLPALSPQEEACIRAWLTHIQETDPEAISRLMDKCHANLDVRDYVLQQWQKMPKPVTGDPWVRCGDCAHFQPIDHPHLGHCAQGEPEAIAGLCYTHQRYCGQFAPKPSPPIRTKTKS